MQRGEIIVLWSLHSTHCSFWLPSVLITMHSNHSVLWFLWFYNFDIYLNVPKFLHPIFFNLITHKGNQNLYQILNTFFTTQICTQTLTPSENRYQFLKLKKINNTSQIPSNMLLFIHLHPSSNICPFEILSTLCSEVQNYLTPKCENFALPNLKLLHCPWPKF